MSATIASATSPHNLNDWDEGLAKDASLILHQGIERAGAIADVLADQELQVRVRVSVTLEAEDGSTVADLNAEGDTLGVRGGGQWWQSRQAWGDAADDVLAG